jgi:hypothetical protein
MKTEPDWDAEHIAMKAKIAAERPLRPIKVRNTTPDENVDDLITQVLKKL